MRHLLTLLILLTSCLESKILNIETADLSQVFSYHEENTLFVFDLDNTLIELSQHLGSDQWFYHRLQTLIEQGMTRDEAYALLLDQAFAIQSRSEVKLVDPVFPTLLQAMQTQNVPIIGLTKRSPDLCERTLVQIAPHNLDFRKTAPSEETLIFSELNNTIYKHGIIFVGHEIAKGPALVAYLKQLTPLPKKIVVVDDKLSHVESVARALDQLNIDCIAIRFSGTDGKAFNPKIADLQWKHFHQILSDEQALHLLQLEN